MVACPRSLLISLRDLVYDEAVSETAELTLVALVVKDGTVEDGG